MKVFFVAPGEQWIVDRFASEWTAANLDIATDNVEESTHVFLAADWCWRRVEPFLADRKVLCWVHHIVPWKFHEAERQDFEARDAYVDAYCVPNERTAAFIQDLTKKHVHVLPYWAPTIGFHSFGDLKHHVRAGVFGIDIPKGSDAFIVGSFQRDGEGVDPMIPKWEKGPDRFVETMVEMQKRKPNLHVLLGGWRRDYVVHRLNHRGVPFTYVERTSTMNLMYNLCDLYVVTARVEGGPQALIEAGLTGTPCVSTPVGIAEQVLPHWSIAEEPQALAEAVPEVPRIPDAWKLPQGTLPYRRLLEAM